MNSNVEKLVSGVEKLCSTVALTLGPKGKNVVINNNSMPLITNDGVTIAKAFKLEDKTENLGAEIAKQASVETNETAGDGTTTALVLTKSLLHNGIDLINAQVNPVAIKKGMNYAKDKVIELIKRQSKNIENTQQIKQVAMLSGGNEDIAMLVAKAYNCVGKYGVVAMQDSAKNKCELNIKKGFKINFGLVSQYLTDNGKDIKFENAKVVISNTKLTDISQFVNIIEYCHNNNFPLVIFAPNFSEEFIKTIVVNKLNGYINVALVSANLRDEIRDTVLDLCSLTQAKLVTIANKGNLNISCLGQCDIFESDDCSSLFINENNDDKFNEYVNTLKQTLETTETEYEKYSINKRIAMLTNGIAVISIGASTDIERTELKLRVEDAIESTKNALKYGVVCGGGMALYKCKSKLKKYINKIKNTDEKLGAYIVLDCLEMPLTQLTTNCGVDTSKIMKKINSNISKNKNYCFNASENKCCTNAYKSGIIDATIVPITALTNAVSVTSTLLSTVEVI